MTQADVLTPLQSIVGDAHVLTGSDAAPYLTDWRHRYTGSALAVVRPASTDEVRLVVRYCAEHGIPMVPQGGNTGLVGGATPDVSGHALVISLARMNQVLKVDVENNTITAQAGVTLAALQQAAQAADRLYPLSLASEGSCTLGGNLATNAGGTAVLRYGNTRELCLGVEAVLADGRQIGDLRGLRKDNTGYDLRHLMIGSEGTLGIITSAVMRLFPLPRHRVTALASVDTPAAASRLLQRIQGAVGAALTGFELMSLNALALVEKHFGLRSPMAQASPYAVLLELSDQSDAIALQGTTEAAFGAAIDDGTVTDVVIAQNLSQSAAFWTLRENISEAQAKEGPNIKHDISVPISSIAAFIDEAALALDRYCDALHVVNFGHLGDGNLHFNVASAVLTPSELLARQDDINRIVHDCVHRHGGSISAEHGLGQLKRCEIKRYRRADDLATMQLIKDALDPRGLMNPGKVL